MKLGIITGVTGQDGSYLAELLLEKNYTVWGIVRTSSSSIYERINHIVSNPFFILKKGDLRAEVTRYTVESQRMRIIAKTEQAVENLLIREHDRKWDLEVFQYGTAVLGGIGGGAFIPAKKAKAVSALGGALAGASAGAAVGSAFPGYGTAIGAAVGAIVGGVAGGLS